MEKLIRPTDFIKSPLVPRKTEPYRILGLDPGSRITGFGIIQIQVEQKKIHLVDQGVLKADKDSEDSLVRTVDLFHKFCVVLDQYQPQVVVCEKIFYAKNVASALTLGQTRGALLVAAGSKNIAIAEYTPTQVRKVVLGSGRADKVQVQKMLQMVLGPLVFETFDASDGLALALCHAYATGYACGLAPTNTKKQSVAQALQHRWAKG